MGEYVCNSWNGATDAVAAKDEGEAARLFAEARFADFPGEYCGIWVSDKEHPEVRSYKVVQVPGRDISETEQFRQLVDHIIKNCGGRDVDAKQEAMLLLAESDFRADGFDEVLPGVVLIDLGRGDPFPWRLAGHV